MGEEIIKKCCVCGKEFQAKRKDQITCASVECMERHRKDYIKAYAPQYRKKNRDRVNKNNREYMRRRRKREKEQAKEDTLIGLNYAERQKQKLLESVEKVRTEL